MKNVKNGHSVPVVCLDPGHDKANYNRSPVVPEYYEGQRMWDLYEVLRDNLESRGIKVIGTKNNVNHAVSLEARGMMAKDADLLISLHSNACGTESVNRAVGIYFVDDNCGVVDEQSFEFAKLFVTAVANTMGVPQSTYNKESSSDRDNDGYKDDYYGVLRAAHDGANTPGIIMEHSFHTNTAATKWLLDNSNIEKLAEAEADAICEWFDYHVENSDKDNRPAAPTTTAHLYRVRKSWDDAKSQLGAFSKLEGAISVCKEGYSVFDWNGVAVYTKEDEYTLEEFIRDVQRCTGSGVDGIAGSETIGNTVTISTYSNRNHAVVKYVQMRLKTLGYDIGEYGADGTYGPDTKRAVVAFQEDNGCVNDGIITAKNKTWKKLLGMAV